ncbi:MAG TPA: hypothetical protein PLC67_08615 [Spirochaetota bacterium]|nr:hypothetical protein [Spirochaetota bacterium]
MKNIKIILITLLIASCVSAKSINNGKLIGVVFIKNNNHYFAVQNDSIANKSKVNVFFENEINIARVESKVSADIDLANSVNFKFSEDAISYYKIKFDDNKIREGMGFLEVDSSTNNDYEIIKNMKNKKYSNYKWCLSNEGVHFNIWENEPYKSKKVWKAYLYLGYDVEPTCNEADCE